MRGFATLLPIVVAINWVAADDKKESIPKLDGTYTIVSGEKDGQAIPEERIKGSVITFKGDRITGTDKDKKEFFAATFQVDTSVKPYKIMMTSTAPNKDEQAAGIIEVDGDSIRLCYALPGGQVPTEFKT